MLPLPGTGATLEGRMVWATPSCDSQARGRRICMHRVVINLGNAIKGKYAVSKERPPGDLVWSGRQKQPGPACGTGAETEGCSAVSEVQGPQARTARVSQVMEH